MRTNRPGTDKNRLQAILAEARRNREQRSVEYRDRALKIFPWICARCGREFSGQKLRELTVHHKDHNHENNPPDGSNWELLCIYCHDMEHERYLELEEDQGDVGSGARESTSTYRPFANLANLLKDKK
jgi:hypothetical protein